MDSFFDVFFGTIGFFCFVKFVLLLAGFASQCQGLACG